MNLEEKKAFFLLEPQTDVLLSFGEIFGNPNPVHLEIGGGRGEFLVQRSATLPTVNFLELEVKGKRIKTMLRKLDPETNANVRLIRRFVNEDIVRILPPASLEKVYIFHPDPWPKRRHFKNRLIQKGFIDILNSILEPGGEILISTDHPGYKNWIVDLFRDRQDFSSFHAAGFSSMPFANHIPTYFEHKKKNELENIYYMIYEKVEA